MKAVPHNHRLQSLLLPATHQLTFILYNCYKVHLVPIHRHKVIVRGGYHRGNVLWRRGLRLGLKEVVADGLVDSTSPVLLHKDIPTAMDNGKCNMQHQATYDHLFAARLSDCTSAIIAHPAVLIMNRLLINIFLLSSYTVDWMR